MWVKRQRFQTGHLFLQEGTKGNERHKQRVLLMAVSEEFGLRDNRRVCVLKQAIIGHYLYSI